jgi:hypothetical protein
MVITVLLLLPVLAVLLWGYGYLLPRPRGIHLFDIVLMVILTILSIGFIGYVSALDDSGMGPVWREILAALGLYKIWGLGLGGGVVYRRRKAATDPAGDGAEP